MTWTELLERINVIPGRNGWWHNDGLDTYRALASELVDAGLGYDKALSVLERAYSAAAGEFGS